MNKLIKELIENPDYEKLAHKIGGVYGSDLWQEFMLMILEKDEDYLNKLGEGNYFKFWVVRSLSNMMSKTGSVGKKYRVHEIRVVIEDYHIKDVDEYNHDIDRLYPLINDAISELSVYERKLWALWLEVRNISEINRLTKIPRRSIYNALAGIRLKVKNKIK